VVSALVTTDALKKHLVVESTDDDDLLERIAEDATDVVVGYLKKPAHGWTDETVPHRVRSAIMLVAGALYANREGAADVLTQPVRDLLHRDRDPAFA
jgi:uncharacterized phage protein (predicted DNA packaging)